MEWHRVSSASSMTGTTTDASGRLKSRSDRPPHLFIPIILLILSSFHPVIIQTLYYMNDLILSTTPSIEGRPVREYKGIVTGESIVGANIFKDFLAGVRDIVGGRAGAYERVLKRAKDASMEEMTERARELGANAILSIDIDYETVGAEGSMLMVAVSGTAVVI